MASLTMQDLLNSPEGRALNARELALKKQQEVKPMAGRRGKRSLQESEALIIKFVAGAKKPVTFLEICDSLERKPAPHFRAIIDRLIETGLFKRDEDYGAGPLIPRFKYSLRKR